MKVYATNNTPAAGKQKGVFCVAAALAVLTGAFAVDLEVTAPTTISSDGDYDNAIVRADLTIASGAKVTATGKGTKVDATVTLTGGAKFATSLPSKTQYSFAEIGSNGGTGGFVVQANSSYTIQDAGLALWIEALSLSAAATTDAEYFDVLTLGKGAYADITCFTNNNDKAARYVFDGGTLRKSYVHNVGNRTAVAPAGKTVIFEGVNGNPIAFTPMYLKENYFFGGAGTFRTQGNCDFILSGIGERDAVPAPNCTTRDQDTTAGATNNPNRAWMRITSNGAMEWNHTGSFRLQGNAWLRLAANNRLPSGANTGGISIEGSSVYRPRLDLNGYSSTINGLVANSLSEVSNLKIKQ